MSFDDFAQDPWKRMHDTYEDSPINIRPAPEYASGEVLLASLMRVAGFEVAEGEVPQRGREFERSFGGAAATSRGKTTGGIQCDTWGTVLHGILESPKQPNQSAKRFLSLSPIVPDIALYSGSARLSSNSWNPGQLIWRMIRLGCLTEAEAATLWTELFQALDVTSSDDVWAKWVNEQFRLRRDYGLEWKPRSLTPPSDFTPATKAAISYPAKRFARDLRSVLRAKPSMTRRQWISLVEAILRIGCVAHVLWLCELNSKLWTAAESALSGAEVSSTAGHDVLAGKGALLSFGNPSAAHVKDRASRYLLARLGLNALMWRLSDAGKLLPALDSPAGIQRLLEMAHEQRAGAASGVVESVRAMSADHSRTLNCKKGIGSNLVEFARHVLGQRQTANDALRGYDQGYFLRKRGSHASAPWVVSLGPVALLAVVHCCLHGAPGPSSIRRLSTYLEDYGLGVDRDDMASSELGQKLRMLGLVLDSPDQESGMLLIAPFSEIHPSAGERP